MKAATGEIQKLEKGQKVYFFNETLPYKVMAVSDRYAVVSRKLNRRQDADLLHHRVEMGAYCSFSEAYKAMKDNPVYSLLDLQEMVRAPHNLVFGFLDYSNEKDCETAIKHLEAGEMELSHRNRAPIEFK